MRLSKRLRDLQLKFEGEETARSVGERGRVNEFDRTMANFNDIFLKNHLRRQELYEKADAHQEERFQKADAAREAIFIQGQKDRARAFEIEEGSRGKQLEWYSAAQKRLFSDGRQRLADKCDALNSAFVEQFDRLFERQKDMMEVAEEQSNHQDKRMPVPLEGSSGPVNSQSVTPLPPSFKSSTVSSSPRAQNLECTSQPTSITSDDQLDMSISQPPSPSMRSRSWVSSPPHPESFTPCTQPTSAESSDQQKQSLYLVEQGNLEGSTQTDGVEDELQSYFMRSQEQRQETFLQDESGRDCRFRASEAARDTGELKRSTIFDQKMYQWSAKPQIEQIRGREEERFRRDSQRSFVFKTAEDQSWTAFEISMTTIIRQTDAQEDLEEIYFKRQEDMLLALYERQAIQLDQRIEDQIISFKFMQSIEVQVNTVFFARDIFNLLKHITRGRLWVVRLVSDDDSPEDFMARTIFKGPFIQRALPVPKVADNDQRNMHKWQGHFGNSKRMQDMFESSQGLILEAFQRGAKERNYTYTINEAKRETEFVKAQQKRKERFDKAEDSRESEFDKAQQQRESEFQTNERKREDDFYRVEMRRNGQAREERDDRAQLFQSIMSKLQQRCIDNEEEQLKELELLGEELMTSREQGLSLNLEKLPHRSLDRSLRWKVQPMILERNARVTKNNQEHTRHGINSMEA
ncbi:hypothetical protein C0992_000672 [Termitomyces sp. T32_za158]|nr:hypothetical protein C0992_000672 [Termitomyces sp. T32_za158]